MSPGALFWASFLWAPEVLPWTVLSLLQRCRRSSVCSQVMWRWPRGRVPSWTVARRLDILSPTSSGKRTACPSRPLIHTTRWVLPNSVLDSSCLLHTFVLVLFRMRTNVITRCQCLSVAGFLTEESSYLGIALTRSHSHNVKTRCDCGCML